MSGSRFLYFLEVLIILVADQLLKYLRLSSGSVFLVNQNLILGWWRFPLNVGAVQLIIATVLGLIGYFKIRSSVDGRKEWLSYGLLAGGGMSNGVDRLLKGGVVDYLDLMDKVRFNLADFAISIGILMLLINEAIGYFKRSYANGQESNR